MTAFNEAIQRHLDLWRDDDWNPRGPRARTDHVEDVYNELYVMHVESVLRGES
jgi:hypothetical protein